MERNKRTGVLVAISFLNQNGFDLQYPVNEKTGEDALASIVEDCAAGKVGKEALMNWFENHKVLYSRK